VTWRVGVASALILAAVAMLITERGAGSRRSDLEQPSEELADSPALGAGGAALELEAGATRCG